MPGVDVLTDPAADLHQRQPLALEAEGELEPLGDVDGLEHLHLLLEGEVGRVAGRVGERAGIGDRADEGRDPAVVAAQLEDLLDDGAVLGLERRGRPRRTGASSGRSSASTKRRPRASVSAAPAIARWRPFSATAVSPPGSRTLSVTSATVPTLRVLAVVLGDEQHALLVADVDRQRHAHVGEDDDVVERDEQ